ncbi:pyridoxal kinase PdxY [Verticiella sediminum]|uniref:pyridoxal kinase n=1 Tax=Verticiella sediminum TaxID=1247510 RepID=A0A556AZM8_9BURK|nr:pyridoxal kinase PdxY [Verticiella sediminum]TSH98391.1 pyridoxal kinase PdxY [Verticiella sediminum]
MSSAAQTPLALSIQSHVALGHVGNTAAVLPLQLLGVEALAIHTVQFSNHTGYGEFKGQVFPAAHVRDLLDGLDARGVLGRIDAVLSGYLGDAATGDVILEAVARIRQTRPGVRYVCDPVMGDTGRGIFVRPGIPEFLRDRAVPAADVITPNQFEFEWLSGTRLSSVAEAAQVARGLLRSARGRPGPELIVVTSLRTPDLPTEHLATLAVSPGQAWVVETPLLPTEPMPNGMGDVFSAVLLGRLLTGHDVPRALEHAVSCLYGLVGQVPPGGRDLPLVAARQEIVAPTARFTAVPLG